MKYILVASNYISSEIVNWIRAYSSNTTQEEGSQKREFSRKCLVTDFLDRSDLRIFKSLSRFKKDIFTKRL